MASDQHDPDALRVHFGEELRRIRMRAKLSQNQLAGALGCTPQWICQLEKADKTVSEQTALDLDTYFKTDGWDQDDGHFHRIYKTIRRAGRHRVAPELRLLPQAGGAGHRHPMCCRSGGAGPSPD